MSAAQLDEKPLLLCGEPGSGKGTLFKYVHDHSPKAGKNLVEINRKTAWENQILSMNGGSILFPEWETCDFKERELILKLISNKIISQDGITHIINARVFLPALKIDYKLDQFLKEQSQKLIHISLPSLRERKDELLDISAAILKELSHESQKDHVTGFEPETEAALSSYDWPGNLRELRNVISFALNRCEGDKIAFKNLPTLDDEESFDFHSKRNKLNEQFQKKSATMTLLKRVPNKNQGEDDEAPFMS